MQLIGTLSISGSSQRFSRFGKKITANLGGAFSLAYTCSHPQTRTMYYTVTSRILQHRPVTLHRKLAVRMMFVSDTVNVGKISDKLKWHFGRKNKPCHKAAQQYCSAWARVRCLANRLQIKSSLPFNFYFSVSPRSTENACTELL